MPIAGPSLVPPTEAAWGDLDRADRAEQHKTLFWEGLRRWGERFGVELVPAKGKLRRPSWDDRFDPPKLLGAVVRFEEPGKTKPRRKSR